MLTMMRLIALLLLLLSAATQPSLGAQSRPAAKVSAYGPRIVCIDGFYIAVAPNEGVSVVEGERLTILNARDHDLLITTSLSPNSDHQSLLGFGAEHHEILEISGIGRVHRYSSDSSEIPYNVTPPTANYVIDDRIILFTTSFKGGAADIPIVQRLVRRNPDSPVCSPPLGPSDPASNRDAALWAPELQPGPFFFCRDGTGFEVRDGEALQRTWSHAFEFWNVRLWQGERWIRVNGPRATTAAAGHMLAQSGFEPKIIRGDPARFIVRLISPDARRRDPPVWAGAQTIEIETDAAHRATALELAGRLQAVGLDDPRCPLQIEVVP